MGHTENVRPQGFWQKGLFDLLNSHINNFNSVLAKLDADGISDTDYESTLEITSPTIGSTYEVDVKPNGIYLGDVVSLCKQFRTNFNALMDKLAADGTVDGITVYTSLKFALTAYLIDVPNAPIKSLGVHQGDIANFLDGMNDRFNQLLDRLDADAGVTDTNYASLYGVTDVVTETSSSSSCRSSSSSSSSCRSSSSSSSSCRSSSSSCRSSSSSSSCRSSSSSSCRSSSSSSSCRSSSSSSCRSSSSSSSCRSSSSSSSCRSSSSSSCRSSSSSCRSSSSSSSCRSSSSSSCRSSSSSCRSSSSSSSCRSSSSSSSCRSSSSSSCRSSSSSASTSASSSSSSSSSCRSSSSSCRSSSSSSSSSQAIA